MFDLKDKAFHKRHMQFAKANRVLISELDNKAATILHDGPCNADVILEISRVVKMPIVLNALTENEFDKALSSFSNALQTNTEEMMVDIDESMDLSSLMEEIPKTQDLLDSDDDAPIIQLINAILNEAIKQQASDVHFEVFEDRLVVRFRIDGLLKEIIEPQRVLAPLIISRLKVMSKLDIAERRIPQDGRFSLRIAGHNIDLRVSTIPTAHGERIVLRILDKSSAHLNLKSLGLSDSHLESMQKLIRQPHGIILVTGPTGSGKTTSLYAALSDLNHASRNILTVEDPIEYFLEGIGQTQVNTKVDMTFAKGLRAILRQDPDIVMVGEIRDLETAEIAVQASLTGHLVLSTLHTNSAIGALTRLRDMGVEPFLLSSSLIGVVAQRLVRLLCPHCKVKVTTTKAQMEMLDITEPCSIYEPKGCHQCENLGFVGRRGIYEIIIIDEELKHLIHENVSEKELLAQVRPKCLHISKDGFALVIQGHTALEEVLRVTGH